MSKQIFLLTSLSFLLFSFLFTGCKQEKKSIDRTLTVPQATVSVERASDESVPSRSMLEFLKSPESLKAVSDQYYVAMGAASSEEFLHELESWTKVTSVEEGGTVYRLEVNTPSVPVGSAILRAWVSELSKADDTTSSIALVSRLILKSETRQIELNSTLRQDYPELVRVEKDQPELLVDRQLLLDLSTYWENLSSSIKDSYKEKRFDAIVALAAIEKFRQAKLNGIQIRGSLLALRNEISACILSWEALDEKLKQKIDQQLNREQLESLQAGLEKMIAELGPDAPEVAKTRRRIETMMDFVEIQPDGQEFPDEAENAVAFAKIERFLDQEVAKFKSRLTEEVIEKATADLCELLAIRSKLVTAKSELEQLKASAEAEAIAEYHVKLLGKFRTCAAKQSDVEAYEKLREQHKFLPEIEFVIRN